MNTDLTVTQERELVAQLNALDLTPRGYDEHVKEGDIAQPPRLRIAQRGGDEIGAGTLYNSLTGKQYGSTIEVIFLMWETDTAVLWPERYDKDNDPVCASGDARIPDKTTDRRPLTDPRPGPCPTCPDFQWIDDRPNCSRQRNCIVWLVDEEQPIRLTLQVSSMPSGKILTNLSASCNVRKSIFVTSLYEDNDKGQYYIYVFTEGNKQPTALSLDLYQLSQTLKLNLAADVSEANGYTPGVGADVIEGTAEQVEEEMLF